MELEKIISEKIRLEETRPTHWDRDRVWHNIQFERKPNRVWIYLAAACLAFAVSLVVYLMQVSLQKETLEKINSLEAAISTFNKIESSAEDISMVATEACDEKVTPSTIVNSRLERINPVAKQDIISMLIPDPIIEVAEVPLQQKDSLPSEIIVAQEETLVAEREVNAIVGYIPTQRATVKSTKRSKQEKLHFDFSREHKNFLSGDREKGSLTARIN